MNSSSALRYDGEANDHSPRKSPSGNSGAFAITYSCNAWFEGASVTSSCLPHIIAHKRCARSGAPGILEACRQ
jgi:hypothetical protein